MSRTGVVVVLGVLLVLASALAFWWFADRDFGVPTPIDDATPSSDAGHARPAADIARSRDSSRSQDVAVSSSTDDLVGRFGEFDVVVVDGVTGAPVPGAEVAFEDGVHGMAMRGWMHAPEAERDRWNNDLEQRARTFGWTRRTNDEGVVRIHLGPYGVMAHARSGDRYGSFEWRDRDGAIAGRPRIELHPDRSIVVNVVDSLGAPAIGVGVEVDAWDAGERRYRELSLRHTTISSAPDGAVVLHHVAEWRDLTRRLGLAAPPFRVRADLLGDADDVVLAVDPDAPPGPPLVLRLPPTGDVEVVATLGGRPLPKSSMIRLTPAGDDRLVRWNHSRWQRTDANGHVRFPAVPLGKRLVVARDPRAPMQQEFDGPTKPGERISIALDLASSGYTIVGRVLDRDGRPIASSPCQLRLPGPPMQHDRSFDLDAEGRFRYEFEAGDIDGSRLVGARLDVRATVPGARIESLRIEVPARTLALGVTDLGDLRPPTRAPLLTGRFVFPPGARVPQMRVQVEVNPTPRTADHAGHWNSHRDAIVETSPDGSFVVDGTLDVDRLRLTFEERLHGKVTPFEFAAGQRDVSVPLASAGSLPVGVWLPDGIPDDGLGLHAIVRVENSATTLRADFVRNSARRGTAHFHSVPAGMLRVEVRINGFADPVAVVDDVRMPLPPHGDPRLEAVDLRDAVTTLTLRVAKDASTIEAIAFAMGQEPAAEWHGQFFRDGVLRMLVPTRPVDVVVARADVQPTALRGVHGEATVTFAPWPEVELIVDGMDALPPGHVLHASVRAEAPANERMNAGSVGGPRGAWFQPSARMAPVVSGRCRLPIGDAARRVELLIHDTATNRWGYYVPPELLVDVPARSSSFRIALDPRAVRVALERMTPRDEAPAEAPSESKPK